MRRPIQLQLLLPMLLLAVMAIGLTSLISGYYGYSRARQQQEQTLQRLVTTLAEATFPLGENVLRQMSGLSGAEFALLDGQSRVVAATLELPPEAIVALRRIPVSPAVEDIAAHPVVEIAGQPYLGWRVPVAARTPGRPNGSLSVLYQEQRWWSDIRRAAYPALIAGAAAASLALALTALLARGWVRPIHRLVMQTAEIADGAFRPVSVPARNDEIRDLALAINSMAEKLGHYEAEVRRHERLRMLGQLGAGTAHQLRNFATGARMAIELHQRECRVPSDDESLRVAMRQLQLMESFIQRFLRLGREPSVPRSDVNFNEVIDEVIELVRPACTHGKVDLTVSKPQSPAIVVGESASLRELLVNVVLNAIEAARRNQHNPPRVRVELTIGPGGRAVVRIRDSGSGPSPANSQRLFEPFVSDKPEGVGLGLYVARQIAESHGGAISWQREEPWTCFLIELPAKSCE